MDRMGSMKRVVMLNNEEGRGGEGEVGRGGTTELHLSIAEL
jgi:hypothetical protein